MQSQGRNPTITIAGFSATPGSTSTISSMTRPDSLPLPSHSPPLSFDSEVISSLHLSRNKGPTPNSNSKFTQGYSHPPHNSNSDPGSTSVPLRLGKSASESLTINVPSLEEFHARRLDQFQELEGRWGKRVRVEESDTQAQSQKDTSHSPSSSNSRTAFSSGLEARCPSVSTFLLQTPTSTPTPSRWRNDIEDVDSDPYTPDTSYTFGVPNPTNSNYLSYSTRSRIDMNSIHNPEYIITTNNQDQDMDMDAMDMSISLSNAQPSSSLSSSALSNNPLPLSSFSHTHQHRRSQTNHHHGHVDLENLRRRRERRYTEAEESLSKSFRNFREFSGEDIWAKSMPLENPKNSEKIGNGESRLLRREDGTSKECVQHQELDLALKTKRERELKI